MQITSVKLTNFGSYKELEFAPSNEGLTLIHGPTGSGKSTLCDAIPWILFGKTAKNGSVDEIRNWNTKEDTTGVLRLIRDNSEIIIERIRGRINDLTISVNDTLQRGRDLSETQKIIDRAIGCTGDTYLAAAYFHEFSQTASFFTTTPKNRRTICEQLVDLTLAKKLQVSLADNKKLTSAAVEKYNNQIESIESNLEFIEDSYKNAYKQFEFWNNDQANKLATLKIKTKDFKNNQEHTLKALKEKSALFEQDKLNRIETHRTNALVYEALIRPISYFEKHSVVCPTCGSEQDHIVKEQVESDNAKKNYSREMNALKLSSNSENPFLVQIEQETNRENNYKEQHDGLKQELNPHKEQLTKLDTKMNQVKADLQALRASNKDYKTELSDIEQLVDITAAFRSSLIKNTIETVQNLTNERLSKHFDAEIKVYFEVESTDKLDVSIMKDGNACVFTQLSKGQRQLLKLCLGVAVMETIAKYQGLQFNCVFFDEAFDGLSAEFKTRCFALLQTLETAYSNIYVVEHSSELKALFTNQIEVSVVNDSSVLHA